MVSTRALPVKVATRISDLPGSCSRAQPLASSRSGSSVSSIVSGPGLATIYRFLAKKFPDKVDKKVHDAFERAKSLQGKI
ncbi:Glucokinase, partial [Phytophthora palmivora]